MPQNAFLNQGPNTHLCVTPETILIHSLVLPEGSSMAAIEGELFTDGQHTATTTNKF